MRPIWPSRLVCNGQTYYKDGLHRKDRKTVLPLKVL